MVIPDANFLEITDELTIPMPALPRPSFEELQRDFPRRMFHKIDRDTSPTTSGTMLLAKVLRPDDGDFISSEAYERRIAFAKDSLLGYQHLRWLLANQGAYPAFQALVGRVWIHFPGIYVITKAPSSIPNTVSFSGPTPLACDTLRGEWKECWYALGAVPSTRVALFCP
jgi:hypothetical protein